MEEVAEAEFTPAETEETREAYTEETRQDLLTALGYKSRA